MLHLKQKSLLTRLLEPCTTETEIISKGTHTLHQGILSCGSVCTAQIQGVLKIHRKILKILSHTSSRVVCNFSFAAEKVLTLYLTKMM